MSNQKSNQLDLLRIEYRDLTGFAAPKNFRAELLKKLLVWHKACVARGTPSSEAFFYRSGMIAQIDTSTETNGDTYIREHKGRTHIVRKIGPGEFVYNGRQFTSLTAVARRITGAHQSGPRFFGLKR
jgi:hypothetical protein